LWCTYDAANIISTTPIALEQIQAYMKEQVTSQKKEPGNQSDDEEEEDGN
jgi:hypothetical protein